MCFFFQRGFPHSGMVYLFHVGDFFLVVNIIVRRFAVAFFLVKKKSSYNKIHEKISMSHHANTMVHVEKQGNVLPVKKNH